MYYPRIVLGGILTNPSLTFKDGVRTIDYVLVWEKLNEDANTVQAKEHRRIFEENLEKEGLQLEREAPENLYGLNFVKVRCFANSGKRQRGRRTKRWKDE